MAMYLLLALRALLFFSGMANSQSMECIDTTPPPGPDSSGFATAENFTETNCFMSNNITCYERCLRPSITLETGMDAYAECIVPENNQSYSRAKIAYHPPNGSQCVRFQSETYGVWHHYDEHIHFRREKTKIEVLILNLRPEHHNLSIVCLGTITNLNGTSTVPEGCSMDGSRATIYVAVEADFENVTDTGPTTSTPIDMIMTDTDPTTSTPNDYTLMGTGGVCPPRDNNPVLIAVAVGEGIIIIIIILGVGTAALIRNRKKLVPTNQKGFALSAPTSGSTCTDIDQTVEPAAEPAAELDQAPMIPKLKKYRCVLL